MLGLLKVFSTIKSLSLFCILLFQRITISFNAVKSIAFVSSLTNFVGLLRKWGKGLTQAQECVNILLQEWNLLEKSQKTLIFFQNTLLLKQPFWEWSISFPEINFLKEYQKFLHFFILAYLWWTTLYTCKILPSEAYPLWNEPELLNMSMNANNFFLSRSKNQISNLCTTLNKFVKCKQLKKFCTKMLTVNDILMYFQMKRIENVFIG